ncbi:[protein release factor]-glutamine N5-methyltransferase [Novosphingobium kunmingense]|uniref:Release factor glutamine methyltransferase n=1 Tax=Novosphingobium kunmingense TaxID=1211806 RepID=A0A2N0HJZ4_9SPHN|nr:peptide chain release factor N(5)-glutamine methyltransferase [Novosphingobium kunmingense]PKB19273.1 [protein release factor]-glutamine N5-methyltransferase [Novosphingobium kunmingense]
MNLPPIRTVAQAIRSATEVLGPRTDSARLDAELLMAHSLGVSRSQMFLQHMGDGVPEAFAGFVERRAGHEPVAYIRGQQEFFGLTFLVTPEVLIPRADSETLVEAALSARPDAASVLDLGTGSGALLLAVLENLPGARGLGIDRSAGALAVARTNADRLGLSDRTDLRQIDWTVPDWDRVLGRFDLVLANPPYVESGAELAPDVRDHEPAGALFAGADGLDDYRRLVPALPELLAPGGVALVEIGATQAQSVCALGAAAGLQSTVHRDLGDRNRVIAFTFSLGNGPRNA